MRTGSAPTPGFWRTIGRAFSRLGRAFGMGRRRYEGASRGRRYTGWDPTNTSANVEIAASLEMLRARSRSSVRDDPHAYRGIDVLARNIVGAAGLTVRADSGSEQVNARAMRAWKRWLKRCDITGIFSLHAVFKLLARELCEAGEVLLRRRIIPVAEAKRAGIEVPMRLEVIEADQLDFMKNQRVEGGGRIQHGVEFSSRGEVVAYWILPEHPGNAGAFIGLVSALQPSVRVEASEIIHLFERLRAGQIRGVPRLAPVLTKLRDHGDLDQANRLRRKLEACIMAFITPSDDIARADAEQWNELSPDDPERQNHQPRAVNSDGAQLEDLQPGMVVMLRNGKAVTMHTPAATPGVVEEENAQLRGIATGLGVTFEQLTGDLSQVNYSSYRAGLIEFRSLIESLQWELFIPVCCERVWDWWCEVAWAVGKVPTPQIDAEWSTARWQSVDPVKDIEAKKQAVESGFVAPDDAVMEEGYHPDDYIAKTAAYNAKLVAAGLRAPTPDVQKTALNGAQVDALKQLASDAAAGLIPVETAKQIALAAFPIDEAAAAAIFDPLEGFKPTPANDTPAPAPTAETEPEPAKNAA